MRNRYQHFKPPKDLHEKLSTKIFSPKRVSDSEAWYFITKHDGIEETQVELTPALEEKITEELEAMYINQGCDEQEVAMCLDTIRDVFQKLKESV